MPALSSPIEALEQGTVQAGHIQFLRLSLAGNMHAVRIDSVREILEASQVTPLPLMPAFVQGVMNLRGAIVPVIDLSARLGLPPATASRRSCVVVVDVPSTPQSGRHTLGALVDSVYEVVDAGVEELEAVPRLGTRIDPRFIRSMVRVRGQSTPELDLNEILGRDALIELVQSHLGSLH